MSEVLVTFLNKFPILVVLLVLLVVLLVGITAVLFLTGKLQCGRDKNGKFFVTSMGKMKQSDTRKIYELVKDLKHEIGDLSLEQLKQTVYSTMDAEERLFAGLKYIHKGGNSKTKHTVLGLVAENRTLYEGIVVACPELKVEGV